jgi:hypothetical protein
MMAAEKHTRLHRSNAPFDDPVDDDKGAAYWDNDAEATEQAQQKHIREAVLTFCRMLKHTKV